VPAADPTPLPNKARVRLVGALPRVPEGTLGTVKGHVGLALVRHRVAFDNGHFETSVPGDRLVRDAEWDAFLARREEEAEKAAAAASAPEPPAAPSEPAPATEPEGGGSAKDERLAALLARSKAAREKKGG
jgi:hypothetical protein